MQSLKWNDPTCSIILSYIWEHMALLAVYVSADVSDSASPALKVSTRERKTLAGKEMACQNFSLQPSL